MPHDTDLLTRYLLVGCYVFFFFFFLLVFVRLRLAFSFLLFYLFSLSLAPAGTSGKSLGMWIEEIRNFFHLLSYSSSRRTLDAAIVCH